MAANTEEKNSVVALSVHETGSAAALSPPVSGDDATIQPFLPPLSQAQWDLITSFIFSEPEIWDVQMALIQVYHLSLLCRSSRDACRRFLFKLDASRSLDAQIRALSRAHISVASLNLDSFTNREYMLRFPNFIEHSSQSLLDLTAYVKYEDTLKNFPQLQKFTLCIHGDNPYPSLSVLDGLRNLRELKFSGFRQFTRRGGVMPGTGFMSRLGAEILNGLDVLILKPSECFAGVAELNSAAPLPARLKKVAVEWMGGFDGDNLNMACDLLVLVYIRPLLDAVDDITLQSSDTLFLVQDGDDLDSAEKFVLLLIDSTKWSRLELTTSNIPYDDSASHFAIANDGSGYRHIAAFSMEDIISELERVIGIERVLEWEYSVSETEDSYRHESLVLRRRR